MTFTCQARHACACSGRYCARVGPTPGSGSRLPGSRSRLPGYRMSRGSLWMTRRPRRSRARQWTLSRRWCSAPPTPRPCATCSPPARYGCCAESSIRAHPWLHRVHSDPLRGVAAVRPPARPPRSSPRWTSRPGSRRRPLLEDSYSNPVCRVRDRGGAQAPGPRGEPVDVPGPVQVLPTGHHDVVGSGAFADEAAAHRFVDGVFERTEVGYTSEWASTDAEDADPSPVPEANLNATNAEPGC